MENSQEKPSPFLKRVSNIEKKLDLLEKRLETIIKSLRR